MKRDYKKNALWFDDYYAVIMIVIHEVIVDS
jgi:hypothetical protein